MPVYRIIAAVTFILCAFSASVPGETYRVFLTNKGISPFVKGSEAYNATVELHSARCVQRRMKVLPSDSLFTIADAPVYKPYLDDLRRSGARILLTLRWSNYVVIECDSAVLRNVETKPYVKKVTPTAALLSTTKVDSDPRSQGEVARLPAYMQFTESCGPFRYGPSLKQNAMIHSDEFHAIGEVGQQTLVGVLDNGFRWREHDSFNQLKVLREYDFIFNDTLTANDSNDVASQDGHGTATLSVVSGFLPDSLIGIAPGASVVLAKTEDMRYEKRIEEDNYAAAIEWMESLGVDVTSSSIGYDKYDSTQVPYSYSQFDGKTTIASRALNRATALGVVCCTSAGNSGAAWRSLISPGDADSALSVGSYDDDSLHVSKFSSRGPNASGRLKPDLSTLGVGVISSNLSSRTAIGGSTGTSFSAPAIAGGVALLLSQFPELTPYTVRELLYTTSSQSDTPDSVSGYGLPNFMRAAETYGIVVSPLLSYAGVHAQYFSYYVRSRFPLTRVTLYASTNGSSFVEVPLQPGSVAHQFVGRVFVADTTSHIDYYLEVHDISRSRRIPSRLYDRISFGEERIPCGMNPSDFPSSVVSERPTVHGISHALAVGSQYLQLEQASGPRTVQLIDAVGRVVSKHEMLPTNSMLMVGSLSRGFYFVEVHDESGVQRIQLLLY